MENTTQTKPEWNAYMVMTDPTIKTIADVMSLQSDSINMHVDRHTIKTRAMDPSHISVIDVYMEDQYFDVLDAKQIAFNVDVEDLKHALAPYRSGRIDISHDIDDILTIRYGKYHNTIKTEASYDLCALPTALKLSPGCKFLINRKDLIIALKYQKKIGFTAEFKFDRKDQQFAVQTRTSKRSSTIDIDVSDVDISIKHPERIVTGYYSIEYIINFCQKLRADVIEISYGPKVPLKIRSVPTNGVCIDLYLAPHVER